MSSAENGRLVWLSEHDVRSRTYSQLRAFLLRRLHEAPADPLEVVRTAVSSDWMRAGMGSEERIDVVYDREGAAIYRAHLVLRALGVPAPPQRPTPRDEASDA